MSVETFWTHERLDELRTLHEEGRTDEELSAHFGRGLGSISHGRNKVGMGRNRAPEGVWPALPADAFKDIRLKEWR